MPTGEEARGLPDIHAWVGVVEAALAIWCPGAILTPDSDSAFAAIALVDRHDVMIDSDFYVHFRVSEGFANQVVLDVVWRVYEASPEIIREAGAELLRLHAFDGAFFALLPFGETQESEALAFIARIPWDSLTPQTVVATLDHQRPRVVEGFELCEAAEERELELGRNNRAG